MKIPCKFDHNGECLVCDCWWKDCLHFKLAEKLKLIDPKYFEDALEGIPGDESTALTNEKVAYKLATYLFDNEGREFQILPKIKEHLPQVYVETLENFVNGNHDT